jgi:hypothetical protein
MTTILNVTSPLMALRNLESLPVEGSNYLKEIPRPDIIAKYQNEMGYVDRHNNFRQGTLHLAKVWWKTKRWQTRIILVLLGLTMVDAYLACRKIMPKWQDVDDSDSVFWKFVHAVIAQIDSSENPTKNCKHVAMRQYKTALGPKKGV